MAFLDLVIFNQDRVLLSSVLAGVEIHCLVGKTCRLWLASVCHESADVRAIAKDLLARVLKLIIFPNSFGGHFIIY